MLHPREKSLDSSSVVFKIFRIASNAEAEPHTPMNTVPIRAFCAFVVTAITFVVVPSGARAQLPAPGAAAAGKSIVGEWEGHVVEGDGSNAGQRHMNIFLTVTDKKITATGGPGQMMGEGTYKITGNHIDATGTSGKYQGHTYLGLISIEGGTLKWCSGNEGAKNRPGALRTNPKDGHFLMVLTRKK